MAPMHRAKLTAWTLVLLGFTGCFFGQLYGWFGEVRFYDELLHVTTAMAITWLIGSYLGPSFHGNRRLIAFGLLVSAGLALGALWEVAEFIVDHFWSSIIRGDADTISDLIADTLGAVLGAAIACLQHSRSTARARRAQSRSDAALDVPAESRSAPPQPVLRLSARKPG